MAAPVSPIAPRPVDPDPAHGGVLYVGPSLTRSLLGLAVALSRTPAWPGAQDRATPVHDIGP